MVPVFTDMVDKNAVSIGVRSAKLFSLAALYDANKELLRFHSDRDEANVNELVRVASEYWEAVSKAIPDWQRVKDHQLPALELRQEKISSHAVVLRALGAVGGELMKESPNDWKFRLHNLTDINWSKGNPEWEGVCIIANSVVSNRQARAATKAYIKQHLGLSLTESEERALAPPEYRDGTWRDDVAEAVRQLGEKPRLHMIYDRVEAIRKEAGRSVPRTLDAIVRRTLEDNSSDSENYKGGPDLFCMPEGRGAGVWALR